jgi:NAD+ synthase (glutamine-hydrolysing)
MNGGLAPLSDVYKTQVYELGREANLRMDRIPERIFSKAPSAELRSNQTDQDQLPSYEELDKMLKRIIEDFQSPEQLIQEGFDPDKVQQIYRLVRMSEFKRFQMPLGLKVSSKAFGLGRRVPLVHSYY